MYELVCNVMEDMSSMHNVMCIGRRVKACKRLSEAAKTRTTRDHVRGISGPSTLFNIMEQCKFYKKNIQGMLQSHTFLTTRPTHN
jgi:hypothetical protein